MDLKECEAFLSRLNQQRIDAKGCDVKLVSLRDGKEFMAHWNVLTAASRHFKRVFHSNFKEAIVGKIELDMDSDIIEILLKYMYTYAIQIDKSIASRLFPEASYLQLNTLKKRCAKFLLANVTRSNCIEMWSFACLYTCEEMKDLAWKMMRRNFDSLTDTPEFPGLDKKDLHTLLTDKSLLCRESSVFSGVCNWVRADPDNRKQHMKELLSLVRLSCLEMNYLVNTVGREPLVTEDKECFQIYMHCLEDIAMKSVHSPRNREMNWKAWTDGPHLNENMDPCSAVVYDERIYCSDQQIAVLSQGTWRLIAPPSTDSNWKLCVVADFMYAIGVVSQNRDVYKFEKVSETWTLVHSAVEKSGAMVSVTSFNDRICVADGRTKTIETLDPSDPESGFIHLCAFPDDLSWHFPLCVVDGRLMIVGGRTDTADGIAKVHVFDAHTASWKTGTSLVEAINGVGATVCDGRLVIAGGCLQDYVYTQHVQILVADEWRPLPALQRARYNCVLVVLDNVLYAIGGYDSPTSVEMLRLEEE